MANSADPNQTGLPRVSVARINNHPQNDLKLVATVYFIQYTFHNQIVFRRTYKIQFSGLYGPLTNFCAELTWMQRACDSAYRLLMKNQRTL